MLGQDWDKTQFLPGNWRFASGNNGLSISDINWWDIEQHLQSCTRGQRRQGCGVSAMRSSLPCLLLLTSLPGVLVRPTMSWTILTRLAATQWRADCQPGCHGKVFQIVKYFFLKFSRLSKMILSNVSDDLQREDGDSWGKLESRPIVNERRPSWDLSRRQFVQVHLKFTLTLTSNGHISVPVALHKKLKSSDPGQLYQTPGTPGIQDGFGKKNRFQLLLWSSSFFLSKIDSDWWG